MPRPRARIQGPVVAESPEGTHESEDDAGASTAVSLATKERHAQDGEREDERARVERALRVVAVREKRSPGIEARRRQEAARPRRVELRLGNRPGEAFALTNAEERHRERNEENSRDEAGQHRLDDARVPDAPVPRDVHEGEDAQRRESE